MKKNNILLIFCTETTSSLQIDDLYIKALLKKYYKIDNSIKLSFVHLNGKGNFDKKSVIYEINKKYKNYMNTHNNAVSYVIYVVDTDNCLADSDELNQFEKVRNFCQKNGYKLIWFCKTIEEVLVNKRVEKQHKTKEAAKFDREIESFKMDERKLSCSSIKKNTSNFKNVLDIILNKK